MNAALVVKAVRMQAELFDLEAQAAERAASNWQADVDNAPEGADMSQERYEVTYARARVSQGLAHARMLRELADVIEEAGKDDDGWR